MTDRRAQTSDSAASEGAHTALEPIARETLAQHGLVLESLSIGGRGGATAVDIVADLPEDETGSADLDTIAEASRALSARLDEDESLLGPGPSVLELGTPGAERHLTELRHWKRARTRLVAIARAGYPDLRVRVRAVEADGTLRLAPEREVDDRGRRLALPPGTPDLLELPWTEIDSARVLLEFTAPDPRAKEH